ncbi:AtpZ/AtpI family protein [Halanaerobacter jeridensis]|uniref:F0F1-type ATP synthase assembly protein I n=1 Tax=Halanaerobacter jeridensis TaxID=706427 RepID=A0A939BPG3_9FIRM|nr:AtpZ/AtpI family protein [Halanaerobacter jeridensis]MBM7557017.1 F0F1-type ATP synthase assembly protein I [Halanaerobacter jeridensis]
MNDKMNFLKALALISQVGITMIVPVIAGVWLGNYLDELLHTNLIFLLVGVILGVSAGFRNAYRLIMQQQDDGK